MPGAAAQWFCGGPFWSARDPDRKGFSLGKIAGVPSPVIGTAETPRPDALSALLDLLKPDMDACGRTIVARMDSPVALIPQLAAHIVAAGGKRLRPLLTLAAARMCGYVGGDRHVRLAACVEFIHTATLLHDDVVDESTLRRGMASANAVFDNKAPVLVGDFMFTRAFQLMIEDGSLHVLRILCDAAATIAEGEVLQLVTQHDLTTTEDRRRLPSRRRRRRAAGGGGRRARDLWSESRNRLPARR
jgi:octaprenyl-diphosphate synthase